MNTAPHSKWQGTAGGGLIYELTHNLHVDAGVAFGVTESAPDWRTSLGINFRF